MTNQMPTIRRTRSSSRLDDEVEAPTSSTASSASSPRRRSLRHRVPTPAILPSCTPCTADTDLAIGLPLSSLSSSDQTESLLSQAEVSVKRPRLTRTPSGTLSPPRSLRKGTSARARPAIQSVCSPLTPEVLAEIRCRGGARSGQDAFWGFQCKCGKSGLRYEDGRPAVQCQICRLWMHAYCVRRPIKSARLVFVCRRCQQSPPDVFDVPEHLWHLFEGDNAQAPGSAPKTVRAVQSQRVHKRVRWQLPDSEIDVEVGTQPVTQESDATEETATVPSTHERPRRKRKA